jgi:hypothetical protein
MRESSLANACRANMRSIGTALASYASQHDGLLPATASIADLGSLFRGSGRATPTRTTPVAPTTQPSWSNDGTGGRLEAVGAPMQVDVRTPHSWMRIRIQRVEWHAFDHSENLGPLVTGQFCGAADLACPACAAGQPCFAYRVPVRGERFMLDRGFRSVVIADSNPLTEAGRLGLRASHLQPSSNHGQSGQNMLFSDGSVEWHTSPLIGDGTGAMDNIWLPRDSQGVERIDLQAWPTQPRDTFVTQ